MKDGGAPPAPSGDDRGSEMTVATQSPARPARSRKRGWLTVTARPYGRVFVDGERVASSTPLVRHPLSTGAHEVRVVHPSLGVKHAVVPVEGGRLTTVTASFKSGKGIRYRVE